MTRSDSHRPSATENPWFWASLFCTAALVALVLAGPRFRWRQPQIERQFQARERSGLSVSREGRLSPISTTGDSMISLRPLFGIISSLLILTWSVWLWQRFGPPSKRADRSSLLLAGILALATSMSEGAEIEAGLAKVDITPPIGGKTAGYASARPADGIHDPISARVLVLKSNQSCIAIVVCDLCVFNSPWLHEQMPAIGIDRLLLMNTHTHAGPDLRQENFPSPEEPWQRTVEQRLLEAIKQAKQDRFAAYFTAGEGRIQLGYNRLVHTGEYSVTHFENPDRIPYGSVDPTVGVIRITDDQSVVRAVLVTYACHPVVLGPRNRKISADYPGTMRDIVEKQLGEQTMCIFIQGAGGDINPLLMARGESRDGDFELVDRMGELLATEVLRVLALIKEQPGVSDEFLSTSSLIRLANRWNPDQEMTLGVTSLLINRSIGILTMPGEPFHRFQVEFRQKAHPRHAFFFGYCCNGPYDWPSYLPDIVSAARGGYGASDTTRAEVGAGERLVNTGLAQLYTLEGRLKPQPQRHIFEEQNEVSLSPK